jgi:hypothetical protein
VLGAGLPDPVLDPLLDPPLVVPEEPPPESPPESLGAEELGEEQERASPPQRRRAVALLRILCGCSNEASQRPRRYSSRNAREMHW